MSGKTSIMNAVRKEGSKVNINLDLDGFPNGDYDLYHKYDPELVGKRVKEAKLAQLDLWLSVTLPSSVGLPTESEEMIGSAARIFKSENKEDLIKLVKWLSDTKDN